MKEEYFEVLYSLRKHHSLFAQFWTVGDLIEIDHPSMPTAGITWDRESGAGMQFLVNPKYWAKLNKHDKAFVIAHEIMHVYLDHGRRSLNLDRSIANVAQDVVINHQLVDVFNFKREELTFGEDYCWRDTVFPDRNDIEPDRCFEYYYQKILEQGGLPQQQEGQPGQGNQTVDIHDFMEGASEELLEEIKNTVDDLMDSITSEEIESFEEMVEKGSLDESKKMQQQAGAMSGHLRKRIRLGKVIKKRKWEEVVCDILGRFSGMEKDVDLELWTRPNRRLGAMDSNLILPASVSETITVRDRIDVFCFQDTSGSCSHLAERFFKAIATIPTDRFRVRVFCFDVKVYETSLESGKVFGGGGTEFQPIENSIQKIIRDEPGTLYPQIIFVVTDGQSWDHIKPEFPERYHWFLTDYHTKDRIPSKSKTYLLKDYE